jgi:hypothetical protein
MFISVLPSWLAQHPSSLLPALTVLLSTLTLSEHPHSTPFPMRSRQDHSGAVALLKLSHSAAQPLSGLPDVLSALLTCHRTLSADEGEGILTERSKMLVLEALARVLAHSDGTQVTGVEEKNTPPYYLPCLHQSINQTITGLSVTLATSCD